MRRWMMLTEASASAGMLQQTFYHGTSSDAKGRSILEQGIIPGNQSVTARGHLLPIAGRSYLTPDLRYGVIYCIGGDMLGCSPESCQYLVNKGSRHEAASQYGWLFVISGQTLLNDIQPDEDSVGAFLADHTARGWDQTTKPWRRIPPTFKPDGVEDAVKARVWHNIRHGMTERQFRAAVDGEIAAQASGGKRALKRLSDHDKLALIRWGAHIAYQGTLIPEQAWRFDKLKTPDLAKDGTNFFGLAERIR